MQDPIDLTAQTYQKYFAKYVQRTITESGVEFKKWLDLFLSLLPNDSLILELGSASGRDAHYFADKGYQVLCTDIIPEALQELSKDGFETAQFDFRDQPKPEWIGKFAGFFADGVLLHATPTVFENILKNISIILKEDGIAAFSLKNGAGEEILFDKMDAPRYFCYHTESQIRQILKKFPFEVINISLAENEKWLLVVIKLDLKNS